MWTAVTRAPLPRLSQAQQRVFEVERQFHENRRVERFS